MRSSTKPLVYKIKWWNWYWSIKKFLYCLYMQKYRLRKIENLQNAFNTVTFFTAIKLSKLMSSTEDHVANRISAAHCTTLLQSWNLCGIATSYFYTVHCCDYLCKKTKAVTLELPKFFYIYIDRATLVIPSKI